MNATLRELRNLFLCLGTAAAVPLATVADVLPDGAFWNKDTAYAAPSPATSEPTALGGGTFSFTSAWDLTLTFVTDFVGRRARGFAMLFK